MVNRGLRDVHTPGRLVRVLSTRVPEDLHRAFKRFCEANNLKMESVFEHITREFLVRNGIQIGKDVTETTGVGAGK